MRCTLPMIVLVALAAASADLPAQDSPRATLVSFKSDAALREYLGRVTASMPAAHVPASCADSSSTVIARRGDETALNAVVTGRIRADGGPAPGAQVRLLPRGIGTVSGPGGEFVLTLPDDALEDSTGVTLRVASIGYSSAQVPLALQPGDSAFVEVRLCQLPLMLESLTVAGADAAITNVQHDGVDEGGIVKLHGNHLVVLRRGRLFTVDIRGGRLDAVAAIDAFPPGVDARGDWYDELLVSGDDVIVIGYSYSRGGTEMNLFRIERDGRLSYRSTYHLRSNDYYSSRNYASRLVDGRLVFYTPLALQHGETDVAALLPALRRWRARGAGSFHPIATATRVYRPARDPDASSIHALHSVTTCDIVDGELDCTATALLGPFAHTFYVSPGSVWLWLASAGNDDHAAMLYRMPLDGAAPTAVGVTGSPIDQFSFLEEGAQLSVLVSDAGAGQWMWGGERVSGRMALLRLPLSRLGDGTADAPASAYLSLPDTRGYGVQNRFVGSHLLYGTGSGWGPPTSQHDGAHAVHLRTGRITRVPLRHGVDRIERLGNDALIVGADEADLHFTSVRLDATPAVADRFVLPGASQAELRSHGFFFRADGPGRGLLGLPVSRPGRPGYRHLFEDAAAVVFLATEDLRFSERGELAALPGTARDDDCRASCVDWYGNARPLFVRGRVFALLGYEIVEGRVQRDGMREVRRTYFGPRAHTVAP
jgi:hypothetical protein